MTTYPVHELFYSWQGEGFHMGKSAFFIRTFGCPVQCAWCDSAGTWHPDYVPEEVQRYSPETLATKARKTTCEFVVITGGEPTIYDLAPLTEALRAVDLKAHLETSGAFPIKGDFAWVTVSPKWDKLPLLENIERADELKIIVENERSIERWMDEIESSINCNHIWLHPEWSQRNNSKVLDSITYMVKTRGAPFRAGFQLHKFFKADSLDLHSRPPAPLGGRIELGF